LTDGNISLLLPFPPPLLSPSGRFQSFKPLRLETKTLYDEYAGLLPYALSSPLYFQSLYAWNFTSVNRYEIFEGHLCIAAEDTIRRKVFAVPPLGALDGTFASAVGRVFSAFEKEWLLCSFYEVPDFMLPCFLSLEAYDVAVSYETDWSDYMFAKEDFCASAEKKSQKEAIRYFKRSFDPRVREISSSDREVVLEITKRFFCAERECSDCFCGCEMKVVSRMLQGWNELDIGGVIVESGGEAIAFGMVCRQKDTLLFLSKKVRRKTRGLNEYLNAVLMDRFGSDCRYVNYSDDMGSEGLRSYKSRLGDHVLMHRYVVDLTRKEK
jgi:hypothetical protein